MRYSVKENVSWRAPLAGWWLFVALVGSALALAALALIDHALPEPLARSTAPPDRFIAEIAYEHLRNLTAIGARVAGSYENEVAAVRSLMSAVQEIARTAPPGRQLEVELHSAAGAFPLDFLDGMNNVYRGVQMVLVRLSGVGPHVPGAKRPALLLNCHFDTVPDSPGASDDGAGCAVLLETLRALVARPQPPLRDLVLLLNGAEENIMQASHGFVTTHRWAKSVRAFLNIEACGAGGREVLFQAGPHDPWIMEVYADAVPHPFASSLAQELFQSGLIPADTDYRIFRDFGNISGVDLAWSANGYVYHTHLDTVDRVPLGALQRTGDNVLALVNALLQSEHMDSEVDRSSRQPVFFDVLGQVVVSARAPAALLAAAATLGLVLLEVHLSALAVSRELYVRSEWWWGAVWVALGGWVRAQMAGVVAAAAVALMMHMLGARLTFYSRSWLLAPLYAAPALAAAWGFAARAQGAGGSLGLRGWRVALAWRQAGTLWAAGTLAVCAAVGLRSGFLPFLWVLCPALTGVVCEVTHAPHGGWLATYWTLGAVLPALQTWYLALGSLRMLVPILGRAGAGPVPADVTMAVLVSSLVLAACSWILPLVVAARNQQRLVWTLWGACVVAALVALVSPPSASYSPERPQRLMVFHVRRSVHIAGAMAAADEQFFWVPELDVNTGRTLQAVLGSEVRSVDALDCQRWPYCGVPYYLPVLSLIPNSYMWAATAPPAETLHVALRSEHIDDKTRLVQLNITGPSHVVVIVSPVTGALVSWSSAVERPRRSRVAHNSDRGVYFFTMHNARAPAYWQLSMHVQHEGAASDGAHWADVSVAGHSLFGKNKLHESHRQLLGQLPPWVAHTGWGVHLQLHQA